jgi:hypothetical protein
MGKACQRRATKMDLAAFFIFGAILAVAGNYIHYRLTRYFLKEYLVDGSVFKTYLRYLIPGNNTPTPDGLYSALYKVFFSMFFCGLMLILLLDFLYRGARTLFFPQ